MMFMAIERTTGRHCNKLKAFPPEEDDSEARKQRFQELQSIEQDSLVSAEREK